MTRLRTILVTTALCTGLLVLLTESQAQGPGRGGRGGPGGGGFGGFGGGFGGFGGGFGGFGGGPQSSTTVDMGLLQNEAVQKEIKLTDKQKAQIEQIRSNDQKKRQTIRDNFRAMANGAGNAGVPVNGGGINAGGNNGDAANAGGNNGGRNRGGNNNGGGNNGPGGGFPGGGPGGGGPGGGRGGRGGGFFGMDPATFEAMRTQNQLLSNETQAELKTVLNKGQVARLQQINLQRADVFAVAWPDIAEKLNLTEEDVQAVQEITQQMWGEMGRARQEQMKNMPRFRNADGSRLSREDFTKKMEEPEVKAQLEKLQTTSREQTDQIRDGAKKAVGRLLTKKQKATFNKMLGAPFDLALLNTGGFFGRGGPNGRGGGPNGTTTQTTGTGKAATTTNAAAPAKTATKPAATPAPKRKNALSSRRDD